MGWWGYIGYKNGILKEIVDILHFAVAFALSFKLVGFIYTAVSDYFILNRNIESEIVFFLSFSIALVLLQTVGKRFSTSVEYDFPGQWDNIVGAIFGAIKIAFAVSFFLWIVAAFGVFKPLLTDSASLYPIVKSLAPKAVGGETDNDVSEAIRQAM